MSDQRPDATRPGTEHAAAARLPRWRRPVVIVSGLLAALLIVVGVVWTIQGNAEARDRAIRDTATGYLKAVADADSAAALRLLAQPPASRDLLTDEVLRASAQAAPLTDIVVTGLQPRSDSATVAVTYKLGGRDVATDLALVGDGRTSWRLGSGLGELMITNTAGLRVNGATIDQTVHPVFPGTYTATPTLEAIALDGEATVTVPSPTTVSATLQVSPRLSDAGLAQSREAARAALDTCVASTLSAPPGCPWQIDEAGVQVTPNSVRYALKNDPWAEFTPTLDLKTLTAKGVAHYTLTATANVTTPDRSGDLTATLDRDTPVTIDLTAQPLKVTWA